MEAHTEDGWLRKPFCRETNISKTGIKLDSSIARDAHVAAEGTGKQWTNLGYVSGISKTGVALGHNKDEEQEL